ncbi:ionotropic receptor 93a-like [Penaeus japonicus]|uniref:ionotropic receptor 93a-like n=1 Tax=Penaeus japonicus TaxID=27405 RepID=UPI001C70C50D|nr:ionotropic receptor 93a-like [Penaeus japonicus]
MAPISRAPGRLESYDYTYAYEFASPAFCMTKPVLKPQWQSLYYPLSTLVWLSALAAVLLMPPAFFLVGHIDGQSMGGNMGVVTIVYGTLLNQSMNQLHPKSNSSRLLLGAWLLFTFILGTAYRGNLTAALTLPKYPPRPETLQELVKAVGRVTMPPYGAQFRDFYKQSDSEVFRALAESMEIVPSVQEGLRQASGKLTEHTNNQTEPEANPTLKLPTNQKGTPTKYLELARTSPTTQAHIQARRYLELVVAEEFTEADGSTRLYFGRESVFPGLSAWPIPHDAPYKQQLDRCIMAIKEAGLYEKWSEDLMEEARKEGRERQKRILQENRKQEGEADIEKAPEPSGNSPKALTIVHLQGPLMLAALGLGVASVTFLGEVAAARWL